MTTGKTIALTRRTFVGKVMPLLFNTLSSLVMASGSITSWQIDGEIGSDFIFLGSKITADVDCSHEIKRRLLLERKVMINLSSVQFSSVQSVTVSIISPSLCHEVMRLDAKILVF